MKMKNCLPCLLGLFLSGLAGVLNAELVYDNSDNFQLRINATPFESGDQVQFDDPGRVINYFAFEYFATPSAATHGASAQVRLYLNDGPLGTNGFQSPGTVIYDSGPFLLQTNASTVEISGISLLIPGDTLTWTVQFFGILTNERAGVLFYDPPGVGRSDDFLWQRENGEWRPIVASTNVVNNLSARFEALPAVRIRSIEVEQASVAITASASPGKLYSLEGRTAFGGEPWRLIEGSELRATGEQVTLTHPSGAGEPFRVYRVVERDNSTPGVAPQ
jgi:hypothetical protein